VVEELSSRGIIGNEETLIEEFKSLFDKDIFKQMKLYND